MIILLPYDLTSISDLSEYKVVMFLQFNDSFPSTLFILSL
jgi:hypothetical protein